ncbi:hypothetical protein [Erythrobacter sp. F6033]|uniref:hypothetical protein n=1 Tax=Erythrobacter sp. F6033 TaxID=2926401 RepID=UPI001FF4966A|nr:hypothetical protein [Erythrobacter sp. F6033]MCK0128286.1 hypothetical protein [Erythrobacter sp. F6033]
MFRDGSNRYTNNGARGIYHVQPEPGKHRVLFDEAKGDTLMLDLSGENGEGTAKLVSNDQEKPFATAVCQFKERDQ